MFFFVGQNTNLEFSKKPPIYFFYLLSSPKYVDKRLSFHTGTQRMLKNTCARIVNANNIVCLNGPEVTTVALGECG